MFSYKKNFVIYCNECFWSIIRHNANLKTILNKLINPYFKIRMKIALMNKNPEKQIANP
jgi:hypothetical protein